jgi:hypothetical protein
MICTPEVDTQPISNNTDGNSDAAFGTVLRISVFTEASRNLFTEKSRRFGSNAGPEPAFYVNADPDPDPGF